MTRTQTTLRGSAAFLALALLGACGTQAPVRVASPVPPASSVAQADARLAQVAAERAAIEARYAEREAVCYDKFFVSNCLDAAKESRRTALAAQRAIEIDAEYFKRKHTVEERDREMAAADAAFKAEEARAAAAPPAAPKVTTPLPPPRPSSLAARVARHNTRAAQQAAQEQTDAPKRTANAAAFEARRKQSEERQRQVTQRKAERAAKQAADKAAQEKAGSAR